MECSWISIIVIWGTCPAPGRPTSESRSSWRTSKFSQNPSPRHTMTYFCKAVFSVPRTKSTLFFRSLLLSHHFITRSVWVTTFSSDFLSLSKYLSQSFLDVSWCLCIFLYFGDPKSKELTPLLRQASSAASSASKRAQKNIEKRRNRTRNRTLFFRLGGSVAQPASDLFAKLSISPHRTRKNLSTKYEWNALKCNKMQQNLGRSETKKRCCCFFLPGNWHSDNVSCVPVKGQHPHDPAFASRFGCGLRFLWLKVFTSLFVY